MDLPFGGSGTPMSPACTGDDGTCMVDDSIILYIPNENIYAPMMIL
jgi:hypothetical protein